MIITIDGPAGAGKSTASRRLAQRLGFEFLDTGAMFRAVGLAGLRAGIDLNDAAQTGRTPGHAAPGDAARPSAAERRGRYRANPHCRRVESVQHRRRPAGGQAAPGACGSSRRGKAATWSVRGGTRGRLFFPMRSVSFSWWPTRPSALAAGKVRWRPGVSSSTWTRCCADIKERDHRDGGRDLAPMAPADDAVLLDTTRLTLDEVVDRMEAEVRHRIS